MCIRSSGIILTPTFVPNFASVTASIADPAHGEKVHTQLLTHSLTHPPYLMLWEPKLVLRNEQSFGCCLVQMENKCTIIREIINK